MSKIRGTGLLMVWSDIDAELYEFEHARVSESEARSRARASNPWTRRVQPNLRHDEGSPGIYQRIYPK